MNEVKPYFEDEGKAILSAAQQISGIPGEQWKQWGETNQKRFIRELKKFVKIVKKRMEGADIIWGQASDTGEVTSFNIALYKMYYGITDDDIDPPTGKFVEHIPGETEEDRMRRFRVWSKIELRKYRRRKALKAKRR